MHVLILAACTLGASSQSGFLPGSLGQSSNISKATGTHLLARAASTSLEGSSSSQDTWKTSLSTALHLLKSHAWNHCALTGVVGNSKAASNFTTRQMLEGLATTDWSRLQARPRESLQTR